jgi:hypothetical protein
MFIDVRFKGLVIRCTAINFPFENVARSTFSRKHLLQWCNLPIQTV